MTQPSYLRTLLKPELHALLAVLGGALFVLAASAFVRGGPPPALILLLIAVVGAAYRYRGAPVLVFIWVLYLQAFPFGVPFGIDTSPVRGSRFRAEDLLTGLALVVYLAAQYRLFVLTDRAVPAERAPDRRLPTRPPVRPGPVGDAELMRLGGLALLAVLFGQVAWATATGLQLRTDGPPRLSPAGYTGNDLLSRFAVTLGGGAVLVFGCRLGFGLWRQNRYSADEGRLVLLDTGWREQRRELARQATWAAWGNRPRGRRDRLVGRVFLWLLLGLLAMVGFSVGLWLLARLA